MNRKLIVALYEPEMPSNVGGIIRTCACFDTPLYVIEPVGFFWRDSDLKRAKMDYKADVNILENFASFLEIFKNHRKILLTPHTTHTINNFEFQDNDVLCFGRESNGIELENMKYFDHLLSIEMSPNCRSLNLSISVGITLHTAKYN